MSAIRHLLGLGLAACMALSASVRAEPAMPGFQGAVAWLNSAPLAAPRTAGQGGARRLLDLFLHQLAAHAALRPRLVREVRGPGPGRARRAHPGVRIRAQRSANIRRAVREHAGRLPGGDRQRLRDLARVRQPVLARAVLRRRAGPHPASPVGEGDYEAAERMIQKLLAEAGRQGRAGGPRAGAGNGQPKPPPIGATCVRRRTTWAASAPKTSLARVAMAGGRTYAAPPRLRVNAWALTGDWTYGPEAARLERPMGASSIAFTRVTSTW